MNAQEQCPSFWAPLADFQCRCMTLVYSLLAYVGSNFALALTTNNAMRLSFEIRKLQGGSVRMLLVLV